jgi:methionine-rich copper-binding protein CopC
MLRALGLLSAVLTIVLLAIAAPASAHTELVSSAPAAGSTAASPTAVKLTFSEQIDVRFARVSAKGPGGAEVTVGKPTVTGTVVSQPIAPREPGKYTVAYRIVSADGHPVSNSLSFTVTAPAAASPSPEPAPTLTPAATHIPKDRGRPWFVYLAVGALCVAGIGALLVRTRSARRGRAQ